MSRGLMDRVCPLSTQFAAYNRISSKKLVVVYPDFGNETLLGFNDTAFELMASL